LRVRDEIHKQGGNYCSVTLQCTFMRDNYKEFPDLIKLGALIGIDRIKGHHLWVHWDAMSQQDMRKNPEAIQHWNQIVIECNEAAEKWRRPDGSKVKLENFFPLDSTPKAEKIHPDATCPFLGKEAWVNHAGIFNPCCAPDAERKELGDFGKVNEGLLKVWQGEKYTSLRDTYKQHKVCQRCNMRKPPKEMVK